MKLSSLQLLAAFTLVLFAPSQSQCPPLLANLGGSGSCTCFRFPAGTYYVGCNGKSINQVVEAIRLESGSFISTVISLSFIRASETFIAANTFVGFNNLDSLRICCSSITHVESSAFASLGSVRLLDLSDNHLRWLSRSSFTGISSLSSLDIRNNLLLNLRSDLEPFFRRVTELTLSENSQLICDCNLSWLADYITAVEGEPSSTITIIHTDLNCRSPVILSITNPSVDFNQLPCSRDWCALTYHSCSSNATCSQAGSETVCTCLAGFSGDGTTCVPLPDPCNATATSPSPCHHNATCTPNFITQTANCTCNGGFTGNGTECVPIDPCHNVVCPSNASCIVSSQGSISQCVCDAGFTGDGDSCVLINPCANLTCHANATCVAEGTVGTCACNLGYTGDGQTCVLINPCSVLTCDINAACTVRYPGRVATCICNEGYSGNGETCVFIDPCSTLICDTNAECSSNNPERRAVCTCSDGYTGDGETCDLLNPCSVVTCDINANCSFDNSDRMTRCTCNPGYTGDGDTCVMVDPCSTLSCHTNATCIRESENITATCVCETGYTGDGMTCNAVDPCLGVTCHTDATCNAMGVCICNTGFTGDGESCAQIDPCSSLSCHDNATCFLDDGNATATCICNDGFAGTGENCTLVENPPCSTMSCHANATCVSDKQFNRCVCDTGFTGDGYDCRLIDPCSVVICHPDATCMPPDGVCRCNSGFIGNGLSCTRDPCFSLDCRENTTCEVGANGAKCVCVPGFVLRATGCELDLTCGEECLASAGLSCTRREGVPTCVSVRAQGLLDQFSALLDNPGSDPGLTVFTELLNNTASNLAQVGDLPLLIDLFTRSLNFSSDLSIDAYMNLVHAGSGLLDSSVHSIWYQLNQSEVAVHATRLLMGLEVLAQHVFLQTNTSQRIVLSSDNVAVVVVRPGCSNTTSNITVSSMELDGNSVAEGDSSVTLPPSIFGTGSNCMDVGLIVVVTDGVGPLLSTDDVLSACDTPTAALAHGTCSWYPAPHDPCANQTVNGVVITATAVSTRNDSSGVTKLNTSSLLEPVRITFQHMAVEMVTPTCAFLNEQRVQLSGEAWLTERCQVVEEDSSSQHTVCECYHLTSFALLTSPTGAATEKRSLQIVSKIGLCISIICLLITIILLFTLKLETKQLHMIHRQLALALFLAQTLFLVGVDRTAVPSHDAVCTTIAALLHYFFLCTFAWQLVEGIHLYVFIVKVFFNEKVVWLYFPFAWGIPAIIVGITLGASFCSYGSANYCWIASQGGAIWAFHGPVLAVLAVNLVIMFIIIFVIVRAARKKENPDTCLFCTLLHASLVLVPILGVSWLFGFFVVDDSTVSEIFEWLFCIFTTLQGLMIFLMHCVLNREVRKAFLNAVGCREAAKKQETIHNMRRASVSYLRRRSSGGTGGGGLGGGGLVGGGGLRGGSRSNSLASDVREHRFKNVLNFTLNRKTQKVDENTLPMDSDISLRFSAGRPSLSPEDVGPLIQLADIQEEFEDDFSLPRTPEPKAKPHPHSVRTMI